MSGRQPGEAGWEPYSRAIEGEREWSLSPVDCPGTAQDSGAAWDLLPHVAARRALLPLVLEDASLLLAALSRR